MDKELQEWLGLAPADFFVYFAFTIIPVIYFVESKPLDVMLTILAIVASVVACVLGMPSNKEFHGVTNWGKRLAYPTCLLICGGACVALVIWT